MKEFIFKIANTKTGYSYYKHAEANNQKHAINKCKLALKENEVILY
jgi:hypothetical protein